MLEALLLTALNGTSSPHADAGRRHPPSLELLEFLGEFGDDEDGLFDKAAGAKAPAQGADGKKVRAPDAPPVSPATPAAPPPAPKERP